MRHRSTGTLHPQSLVLTLSRSERSCFLRWEKNIFFSCNLVSFVIKLCFLNAFEYYCFCFNKSTLSFLTVSTLEQLTNSKQMIFFCSTSCLIKYTLKKKQQYILSSFFDSMLLKMEMTLVKAIWQLCQRRKQAVKKRKKKKLLVLRIEQL